MYEDERGASRSIKEVGVVPVSGPRKRWRLLVWFDDEDRPTTAAVALYIDDVKQRERCWHVEPFDDVGRRLGDLHMPALDEQLSLW